LGDDTPNIRVTPAPVPGLNDVIQVGAGGALSFAELNSVALKRDGTVWTWGANRRGQLGDGTKTFRSTPTRLDALNGITRISTGGSHVLASRSDGVSWAWGANEAGQVGDGSVADRFRPVIVVREGGAGSFEVGDWFLDLDPAANAVVALD